MTHEEFLKKDNDLAGQIACYEQENCKCITRIALNKQEIINLNYQRITLYNEYKFGSPIQYNLQGD